MNIPQLIVANRKIYLYYRIGYWNNLPSPTDFVKEAYEESCKLYGKDHYETALS